MKKMTKDERMALLVEVNKLLATIPDYQLAVPEREIEYDDILISDQGYVKRYYLEYGEVKDVFLGKTREEAIASLAHGWVDTYRCITAPNLLWPNEKNLSPFDKIERFRAHCDSYIYKNMDYPSAHSTSTDDAALKAVNQKAAAILQKLTAYDVVLDLRENDKSYYPERWYKKEGEQWAYYTREGVEVNRSICAENDDEMVRKIVYSSLENYALQHFVFWRERDCKDPYRNYDDFMEECLRIVYPDMKYQRHPVYDDRKYEELDAKFFYSRDHRHRK